MLHSVKISRAACQGCVNCIRVCPTEAIRIVDGEISILEELCIDCGECLRSCHRQALGIEEDDWNAVKENPNVPIVPDRCFSLSSATTTTRRRSKPCSLRWA